MLGRTVVVFTGESDVTADYVIHELNQRKVPVMRCDPGDLSNLVVGARSGLQWTGHLSTSTGSLDLPDIACCWWRRPTRIEVANVEASDWATDEARAGLRGLLACLPWLNHPDHIYLGERKPLQLWTAVRSGLEIPQTLITNSADEVRSFAKEHGQLIYKPLKTGLLSGERIIYAAPVDVDDLDGVEVTMNLFQQEIPKDHELRVTVVDSKIFTARIDAHSDLGRQDWRADYTNLTYTAAELPPQVATALLEFMTRMRLRFAAIDMIVTPDGRYLFLEANPNGQWAWIEDETALPIASAIADALEGRSDGTVSELQGPENSLRGILDRAGRTSLPGMD